LECQGTFMVFTGFGHFKTLETSGRNMTVELDNRHLLLPKAGWGKWRFDSDLKGENGNLFRRLEMVKSGKNHKCSFFITKSAVEPKNE
jgi:hypothetical protein